MVPIYEQLTDQVKNEIISGRLAEGAILPSVRALSAELRISALTVKKAYDRLEEEGFVVTVHGKGTYVAAADLKLAAEARRKDAEDGIAAALARAGALGFTEEEILEIVRIILEDQR
jgi:GntR family transcriptional regulator